MKIRPCSVFGAKLHPGRLWEGHRNSPYCPFYYFFEILFGIMGPFSVPREIADRSKIVLLIIDGHFDTQKMPSGRGFGKNLKILCKIDAKIDIF